jgi:hypothetical protein
MKLTNDSYVILIGTENFTERYYRDKTGWLKVSARGQTFRMTAEQVRGAKINAIFMESETGIEGWLASEQIKGTQRRWH